MTHYVAIIEEEPGKAVGVWFPELPGCFSAGDSVEEAMLNAREAISLWADAVLKGGRPVPRPRSISELRADSEAAADLDTHLVALIPLDQPVAVAAE